MDRALRQQFDSGDVGAPITGDDGNFIRSPGFDVHDRLFVFSELLEWAGDDLDRQRMAARGFSEAVSDMLEAMRADDAVDTLVSYSIVRRETGRALPIDRLQVEHWLDEAERVYTTSQSYTSRRQSAIDQLRSLIRA